MDNVTKYIRKLEKLLHLRPRKMHLDYIAGLLSIPVLVTAIILNYGNLRKNETQPVLVTPTPQIIVVPEKEKSTSITPQICQKKIGPIEITYPKEGQTVSDNPVCITIDYSDDNYCSVVWSYRINNGTWSEYNNNAPCLYNVPNGSVQFQLRVNSVVSSETKTLIRNFTYNGANNISVTPTSLPSPTASVSANGM